MAKIVNFESKEIKKAYNCIKLIREISNFQNGKHYQELPKHILSTIEKSNELEKQNKKLKLENIDLMQKLEFLIKQAYNGLNM